MFEVASLGRDRPRRRHATVRYTELWDGLTINQRRVLEAIGQVAQNEEILSEEFRRRHRLGAYATAERAFESLVERGLVEREGRSQVLLPDVFLRFWLRQASP